jgi:hypothetical protein
VDLDSQYHPSAPRSVDTYRSVSLFIHLVPCARIVSYSPTKYTAMITSFDIPEFLSNFIIRLPMAENGQPTQTTVPSLSNIPRALRDPVEAVPAPNVSNRPMRSSTEEYPSKFDSEYGILVLDQPDEGCEVAME